MSRSNVAAQTALAVLDICLSATNPTAAGHSAPVFVAPRLREGIALRLALA